MKILVIGSGGREHALAWKLAQPAGVEVFAAPGNPGIARIGDYLPIDPLAQAEELDADLTVVGPEAPLVDGYRGRFRARGLRIVGPAARGGAARGQQDLCKDFFVQSNIPTAGFVTAESPEEARKALGRFGFPVVLKADGLAAGKGVVIAHDRGEAEAALASLKGRLRGRGVPDRRGSQLHRAVRRAQCVAARAHAGPQGGLRRRHAARIPAAWARTATRRILTEAQAKEVLDRVIRPTVERTGFTGFLYAGLMMTAGGSQSARVQCAAGRSRNAAADAPHGLGFRPGSDGCRRRQSGGHAPGMEAGSERLRGDGIGRATPAPTKRGSPITGIEEAEAAGATVFQAGTRMGPTGVETAGGRVLGVTASGNDLAAAIHRSLRRGAARSASTACITAPTLDARGWDATMEEQSGT